MVSPALGIAHEGTTGFLEAKAGGQKKTTAGWLRDVGSFPDALATHCRQNIGHQGTMSSQQAEQGHAPEDNCPVSHA